MPVPRPSLRRQPDAAAWFATRLDHRGTVTSWVPGGFEAYARILHPARDPDGHWIRWAQVAEQTERQVTATSQWHTLVGSEDPLNYSGADWTGDPPPRGLIPRGQLVELLAVLAQHTATPDNCWMCVWEGFGWLGGMTTSRFDPAPPRPAYSIEERNAARVLLNREYLLLHGSLESALAVDDEDDPDWQYGQSPNLMWPDDRSWALSTDIDDTSTLLAGSSALVSAVLTCDALEAFAIDVTDRY